MWIRPCGIARPRQVRRGLKGPSRARCNGSGPLVYHTTFYEIPIMSFILCHIIAYVRLSLCTYCPSVNYFRYRSKVKYIIAVQTVTEYVRLAAVRMDRQKTYRTIDNSLRNNLNCKIIQPFFLCNKVIFCANALCMPV